jgi:dihydroorotase
MTKNNWLITNARVVNEGKVQTLDVRIQGEWIERIDTRLSPKPGEQVLDANGKLLLPGMIDDQVHFREPGLTNKGSIFSESCAAVAGGITSYMEMPNVNPATTDSDRLEHKFGLAEKNSLANYSFYLGASNDNLEQIKRLSPERACGVKVFMGASTGNLLVDDDQALEAVFRESPVLIVTHCEDNATIQANTHRLAAIRSPADFTAADHPILRDDEACYRSSSKAVGLARRYQSDLHVLHITTAKELSLFEAGDIASKSITAEACVHHLWFSDQDYAENGNLIKCNPAIKTATDRQALMDAVNNDLIDIIATDHAPHNLHEKQLPFIEAPAGLPLVQHALLTLMDQVKQGNMTIETLVKKVAHNPAIRYQVDLRGFIREGYYADLVLVDPDSHTPVTHDSTLYRCGWTPFAGHSFQSRIAATFVNGSRVYDGSQVFDALRPARALTFHRHL